jgi:hypothetical protein
LQTSSRKPVREPTASRGMRTFHWHCVLWRGLNHCFVQLLLHRCDHPEIRLSDFETHSHGRPTGSLYTEPLSQLTSTPTVQRLRAVQYAAMSVTNFDSGVVLEPVRSHSASPTYQRSIASFSKALATSTQLADRNGRVTQLDGVRGCVRGDLPPCLCLSRRLVHDMGCVQSDLVG